MIYAVILAYNEEAGIGPLLEDLDAVLRRQDEPYQFVVVDDGSRDATASRAGGLAGRIPVVVLSHETNLGVGRAFDTGLRHVARAARPEDLVFTLEGDRTNDPAHLLDMLAEMRQGRDVVCASRYRPGGRYVGFPLLRRLFSTAANWTMRLLFPVRGVRDFTIFYRLYRVGPLARAVERFGSRFIESPGFAANAEILFKLAEAAPGLRCAEAPLVYRYDLKKGRSKMRVGRNLGEYGKLFARLTLGPVGATLRAMLAVAATAVLVGSCGIGWGLPSRARLAAVLPPGWIDDAAIHDLLASSREELYQKMEGNARLPVDDVTGLEVIERGLRAPAPRLLNSYRSFFLRSSNPDEQKNLTYLAHMKPARLQFEPFGVGYGGGFIYPLGAYYGALASVGAIRVTSDVRYYFQDVRRMAAIFIAGRWLNVLCFAGCALLIYRLVLRLGGQAGALGAAGLFLASPVAVIVEHTLNPYGWATLWFLLGCYRLAVYLESGERGDLLWGAACVGLCIGSSFAYLQTAVVLAAPLFLERPAGRWREALFRTVQAAVVAAAVAAAANPFLFLRFEKYGDELAYLYHNNVVPRTAANMRAFVSLFMAENVGWGLTAACLASAAGGLLFFGRAGKLLSAATLAGLLHVAGKTINPSHGRHLLPFFALGAALTGLAFQKAVLEAGMPRWRRSAGWALLGLLLAATAAGGGSYLWNFRREALGRGSRELAGGWIESHVPSGSSVGIVQPPQPYGMPPFRFDLRKLVLFTDPRQLARRPLPDYVILPGEVGVAQKSLTDFLSSRYVKVAAFGPERLLPWVRVRGAYMGSNMEFDVYQRK